MGSLTGDADWPELTNAYYLQPGLFPELGCWAQDRTPVVDVEPVRTYRPQDAVISIPTRFAVLPRARAPPAERATLAFFAGSPNSCARREVVKRYAGRAGFAVGNTILTMDEYREAMWSAQFCLILRGSSHTNNVRLYDTMLHGCIPVIITDDFQPPLDSALDWPAFAVFLRTDEIPALEAVLREMPEDEKAERHAKLVGIRQDADYEQDFAARYFEWHKGSFWITFLAEFQERMRGQISSKTEAD